MKILADRHEGDRQDLSLLIRRLRLRSVKDAERAFLEVYPDGEIPPDTRARLADIFADEAASSQT